MSGIQVVCNATHDAHRNLATKYRSALYHNLLQSGVVATVSWVSAHADQDRFNNRGVKVRNKKSLNDFTTIEWVSYLADKFATFIYNDEQILRTEKMLPRPVLLVEAHFFAPLVQQECNVVAKR